MNSGWLAGSATTTFPVPSGTELGGYADRDGPSTDIHDALEISALVLACNDRQLSLVTTDLVCVDADLRDELARVASISPADLIIAASHTHSGPLGVAQRLHPANTATVDLDLRQRWIEAAASVLGRARSAMTPVVLEHGSCEVAGAWTNRNHPSLPADLRVKWLRASTPAGVPLALTLLAPCHPTVLGSWNRDVSADLHGGIRRALRPHLPASCGLLTMTGAAGDISTRFSRRESSFAEVDRLGMVVAEAVLASLPGGRQLPPEMSESREKSLELPVRPLLREQAAATLAAAEQAWQAAEVNTKLGEAERRRIFTEWQGAHIQQRMTDMSPIPATITGRSLGESLDLVAVPGELFSSAGRELESQARNGETWVVGYANGYVGYLADQPAHKAATYEALASPYPAATTDLVVSTAVELLARINRGH